MKLVQPIRDKEILEDIKLFYKEDSERNYVLFLLGINTGLRISDILRLKVNDVKDRYIVVVEQKTKKQRWIKVTSELRKALKEFIADKEDNEYLFKSRQGRNKPIGRSMAYKILRRAADEFKLKNIGTHTLRKTFGYHFYYQTKDVAMLQEIFSHSDPAITRRYIGVNQDAIDQAMSKFKI
ncbi:site-specific integrase [Bacillaceae bacterium SAOS 7]|nr:site-specific integrase [Bacillaceae bacterium SAOS 7]